MDRKVIVQGYTQCCDTKQFRDKMLGKCEENYFMLMSEQVLRKEISFKTLAENHQTYMEIEKVNAVLAQISGFQSKQKLRSLQSTPNHSPRPPP